MLRDRSGNVKGMLEKGKKKIQKLDLGKTIKLMYGDSEDLPFENDSFDAVTVGFGVRNFENLNKGLEEIKRVMKKGGLGIVQVPFYDPIPEKTIEDKTVVSKKEREKLYGQSDHVRKYGKEYKGRLESTGLHVKVIKPNKFLNKSEIRGYGIIEDEELFIIINHQSLP